MLKKTITYVDYDGNKRTEDHYFNLSKAELIEMDQSNSGGLGKMVHRIIQTQDSAKQMALFKEMICRSYGIKSDDGKRFIKNKEVLEEFLQTEAYTTLFMELASNAEKAAEFVRGIVPKDLAEKLGQLDSEDLNA